MPFFIKKSAKSTPITPLKAEEFDQWLTKQDAATKALAQASHYRAAAGSFLILPHTDGSIKKVIFGTGRDDSIYTYASLPAQLPLHKAGYYIDAKISAKRLNDIALGWALGSYSFGRYKKAGKRAFAQLAFADSAAVKSAEVIGEAIHLVRDLVNTPANDMGPAEIAAAASSMAKPFKDATVKVITGKELERKNYPAIYAVGKGSPREPRLIDIRWGANKKLPLVTLVGKGVAFDTGGLDIKPGSAMILMKKDMGGAAHVIALAQIIMTLKLPVRLRVLIPAVENSIDGHSFRPSDVLQSRKGITIEVGNTDAEGRLILCDALTYCQKMFKPTQIVDLATLTGAVIIALGGEYAGLFANDDALAQDLINAGKITGEKVWMLPLSDAWDKSIDTPQADMKNISGNRDAGSAIGAHFLKRFINDGVKWAHLDIAGVAWSNKDKTSSPKGATAFGVRLLDQYVADIHEKN